MPLLFLIDIGDETIRALNWTLIHSLWQGMLLSLVAGSIIFFTKKSSPSLRYYLLTVVLFFFIVAVAATFSLQLLKVKQGIDTPPAMPSVEATAITQAMQPLFTESKLYFTGKAIAFFNVNANWIVLTWLLIIGLQFIRLTAGLYGVYQLKRRQTFSAGEYWNKKTGELSRQLQINKKVRLLQSGIAKIPAVIGYFKPVILFPAGLLASLPVNEVEAILLHELAHIRRKDFLVNLVQHLIEIIFFFNPAVLWVSSLIKSERENCCDDIAVNQTDSKQNYIKALMSFEGFNLARSSPLANAFSGEKNHLMNRVKRIIYNNNKTLNNMEKKFLAAGMIITSVFIFAFSSKNAPQKGETKNIVSRVVTINTADKIFAALSVATDTVPVTQPEKESGLSGKITTTVNGKKYTMVTANNQVTELYVNDKKIPAEKMGDYKNVTNKILKEAKLDKEQSEKDMAEAAIEQEQAKKEMEESTIEMAQAKIEMEEAEKQMVIDKQQAEKDMAQSKIEMEQSKEEMAQSKIEMAQSQKEMKQDMKKAKIEMEQSQKEMMQSKKEMEKSRIEMAKAKKDMEQSKLLQEKIIGDFINEHIIKDKADLVSYKLSNEELIVNDVKQSDEIFKKFKDKYVKNKNWTIMYNSREEPQ